MEIDLTQEQVKELFDYDSENGWLIRKKDEYGRVVNRPCGHKPTHSAGYGVVGIAGEMYLTHRVVWLWHHGYMPEFIDHKDRNPMNNRIENLRPATRAENSQNISMNRNNTSGFTGVCWDKRREKYMAYIWKNNKQINLGRFDSAEEAYLEYMLAKIELHPTSPIAQEYLHELTLAG